MRIRWTFELRISESDRVISFRCRNT